MLRCTRTVLLLLGLTAVPVFAGEPLALFNGRDLEGWVIEGPKEFKDSEGKPRAIWSVQDGTIRCEGKGFGFLRYGVREFADFRLSLEFRLAPKGNSGIGVRTTTFDPKKSAATRPSYYSYEIQIFDDHGKNPDKHSTASLYRYVAPTKNAVKPAGEWNAIEVECVGPRIRVVLNGEKVQDFDQSTLKETAKKPLKGYVCVQNHGSRVEFRKILLEPLSE